MKKIPVIMWPIAGITLVLLLVAAFISHSSNRPQVCTAGSALVPGESLAISEIKYDQDYEDGKGWELIAKEAHFFDATQLVSLKNVLLTVKSPKDNSYKIKGNEGDYCRKSEEIVLKGNVVGNTSNGYQIETSQLTYKQKEDLVVTDKRVEMSGPFFKVEGEGLSVELGANRFKVWENVYTTITGGDLL